MKTTYTSKLAALFSLLIIWACTKKVDTIISIDYTIDESYQDIGYVNTPLSTLVSITPIQELEGFDYFVKYEVLEGDGFFQSEKGILNPNEFLPLSSLQFSGDYLGNSPGTHQIKITFKDEVNLSKSVVLSYTIDNLEVEWTATVEKTTATVGYEIPINVSLVNLSEDEDVAFQSSVSITEGEGTLTKEGTNVPLDKFNAIVPGTYQFIATGSSVGNLVFSFTVKDNKGQELTALVELEIVANQPPLAVDDKAVTQENNSVIIPVLNNDSDAEGDPFTITEVGNAENGTVELNEDTIIYTPNPGFSGEDTFTYEVTDEEGGSSTGTVVVTVSSVDDAPHAVDDAVETLEDNSVTIAVLENDSDIDGDSFEITNTTQPQNGTLEISNNNIIYTPAANFNGSDSFEYTITDEKDMEGTAVVTVTVLPVNDAPIANNDQFSAEVNVTTPLNVLTNDTDIDGDDLTVVSVGNPTHGTANVQSNSISYTPEPDYSGPDSFTYTIEDSEGVQSTATVTVEVQSTNNPPVAVNDESSTNENQPVTVQVLSNDTDIDGDDLTVVSVGNANNGTTSFTNSSVTYTPASDHSGPDSFTYTIEDSEGAQSTATVTIEVQSTNTPPIADFAYKRNGPFVTFTNLSTDSDVEQLLTYKWSFGDRTTSTSASPNHKYNSVGTFNVTLEVSDGIDTSTHTEQITISTLEYLNNSNSVFYAPSGTTINITISGGPDVTGAAKGSASLTVNSETVSIVWNGIDKGSESDTASFKMPSSGQVDVSARLRVSFGDNVRVECRINSASFTLTNTTDPTIE